MIFFKFKSIYSYHLDSDVDKSIMPESANERMNPPVLPIKGRPYVLISLCFLGVSCRYHAETRRMGRELMKKKLIMELSERYNILPLCGEQIGGLPTPREPCKVVNGKVIDRNTEKTDYTKEYYHGAQEILRLCRMFEVEHAYLLKDSPMCGKGYGILAKLLEENGIIVHKK